MQRPFKPTYLYIKTHKITGLKYFGKTVKQDPYKYKGSGKRWTNHIKVYGYIVDTEVLGYYTNADECMNAAIEFSIRHNIVESSDWANLKIEDTKDGGAYPQTEESIRKRSKSLKGKPSPKKGKPSPNKGRVISDEKRKNMNGPNSLRRICRLSDRKEMSVNCFTRWTKD